MLKAMMAAAILAGAGAMPALAADNPMQVCGARYQAAKAAKTLPAGQTWPQFLAGCRASLPKPAAAAAPAVAKAATVSAAPAVKAPTSAPGKMTVLPKPTGSAAGQASAAQLAARSRQKQCSQNYQADKAANKLAGQSWPKYYSACNARLKG